MGLFDFFTGTKPPAPGARKLTAGELRHALLSLNRETAPWHVREGGPEGADLVAEWKIVDARWYEIFAKASLSKVFQVLIKFDEPNGQVRVVDKEYSVEWRAGVPTLSVSAEAFRGQKMEMSFGTAFAFREDLSYGQVYQYRFATKEIKEPLQQAVAQAGWGWKGVAFGKL